MVLFCAAIKSIHFLSRGYPSHLVCNFFSSTLSPIGVYVRYFYDRCWVVHIPFVCMVKFKFLVHLPVDHLADPVVSSLIFLLCYFVAFAYDVIDGFISVTA